MLKILNWNINLKEIAYYSNKPLPSISTGNHIIIIGLKNGKELGIVGKLAEIEAALRLLNLTEV